MNIAKHMQYTVNVHAYAYNQLINTRIRMILDKAL